MNSKKRAAVVRSVVIISILVLSVLSGLFFQFLIDKLERREYPMSYADHVTKYASQYGVPEHIVYAVIKTESDFQSGTVSDAGAVGLMQLMPDTFNWLCTLTRESHDTGMLYDPETNIKYGTYYLSYLYLTYGDWDTVFAAYNAGTGNVNSWLGDKVKEDGAKKLDSVPFEETRKFIEKVNKADDIYMRLYFAD